MATESSVLVQEPQEGSNVEAAGSAMPQTGAVADEAQVNCAKCKSEVPKADCIERPRNREQFRWCCKACHALSVQFQRKGLSLQTLLSEDSLVQFFSAASEERRQATENRLSFSAARALLKQSMVTETKSVQQDGRGGSYQPLAWYELRGYDVDAIKANAPCEKHAILGDTYLVQLHHSSDDTYYTEAEQRITRLECEARQRRQAAPSVGVPVLDLPETEEPKEVKSKGKRGLTDEEREAAKRQRLAAKKQEAERKVATSAAVKLLPALKSAQAKLADKIHKLGTAADGLPEATKEQVETAQVALEQNILGATKLLDCAAKGKAVDATGLPFTKDKDLQGVVKDANAALRAVSEYVRAQKQQKENMNPNGEAKAKAKK